MTIKISASNPERESVGTGPMTKRGFGSEKNDTHSDFRNGVISAVNECGVTSFHQHKQKQKTCYFLLSNQPDSRASLRELTTLFCLEGFTHAGFQISPDIHLGWCFVVTHATKPVLSPSRLSPIPVSLVLLGWLACRKMLGQTKPSTTWNPSPSRARDNCHETVGSNSIHYRS